MSDRFCDSFLRSCWIENFNSTLKNRLINNMLFLDIVAKIIKITTNVMAHMGKNEDIRVESLVKLCTALGCTFDDIAEIIPDKK